MTTKQRKGPLARFTVLDLTRARSGPTAVRQLADWGANVIKLEEPGDKVARWTTAATVRTSRTCTATSAA